jgi:hypothetical protein
MAKKRYIETDETKPKYLMDLVRKAISERISPDIYVSEQNVGYKIAQFLNPEEDIDSRTDEFSQDLWKHFLGQENNLTIENDTVRLPDDIKKYLKTAIDGGLEKERKKRIKERDSLTRKIDKMIDQGKDIDPEMFDELDVVRAKVNWLEDTMGRIKKANSGKPTVFNEYDFFMDEEGTLTPLSGLSSFTMYRDKEGKMNVKDKYDFYSKDQTIPLKAVTLGMDKILGKPFPIADKFREGGSTKKSLVDNQYYIYNRLINDYQLPDKQAIAIVANLTHESGLNTGALGDSGASYGIQQWKGKRRDNLMKFAKERGNEEPTLDDQIDFLMKEYNTGNAFQFNTKGKNLFKTKGPKGGISEASDYYQFSKADFDNAENLFDATIAWNQGVGRPHKKWAMNDKRYQIAQNLAKAFGVKDDSEPMFSEQGYIEPGSSNNLPNVDVVADRRVDDGAGLEGEEATQQTAQTAQSMEYKSKQQEFFELYGKDILSQLFAYNTNRVIQNPEEDEYKAKEIARQQLDDSKQRLIAAFLPNIQLNIKGVTQIHN